VADLEDVSGLLAEDVGDGAHRAEVLGIAAM